jgi:hypothetical protein
VTTLNAEISFAESAAKRLRSTRAPTRVLYLASSALTGAVLYLLVSWPHPHTPVQAAASTPVAAPPPQATERLPTVNAQESAGIVGPTVLEAVRAVAGTAKAQEEVATVAATNSISPAFSGLPTATGVPPVASAGTPAIIAAAASEPAQSNSITSATASSFVGASVDARQPAMVSASPNHIGVPGAQAAVSPGNAMLPAAGTNRITIPATPPH